MIVIILFGIVSIAALCLSILSLCRSSKERLDTQYIATDGDTNADPELHSKSFSDSIEKWLSDRQVTIDGGKISAPTINTTTINTTTINTQTINTDTISAATSISAPTILATTSISAPTISATTSISAPTISAATSISAPTISAATSISTPTISADSINYQNQTFTKLTRLSGHAGAGCFMCTADDGSNPC